MQLMYHKVMIQNILMQISCSLLNTVQKSGLCKIIVCKFAKLLENLKILIYLLLSLVSVF